MYVEEGVKDFIKLASSFYDIIETTRKDVASIFKNDWFNCLDYA